MFLSPLAIVLVLLTLAGRGFGNDPTVLRWALGLTGAAALFDGLGALPASTRSLLHLDGLTAAVLGFLPLSGQGFGWVCPALLGVAVGLVLYVIRRGEKKKAGGER